MVDLGVTGPPRFPQRVTFIATLTIDTEGMDWAMAVEEVERVLCQGNANGGETGLDLVKVTRMEIVEED